MDNARTIYEKSCVRETRYKNAGRKLDKAVEVLSAVMAIVRIMQIVTASNTRRATKDREDAAMDLNVADRMEILRDYKWG